MERQGNPVSVGAGKEAAENDSRTNGRRIGVCVNLGKRLPNEQEGEGGYKKNVRWRKGILEEPEHGGGCCTYWTTSGLHLENMMSHFISCISTAEGIFHDEKNSDEQFSTIPGLNYGH